MHVKRRMPTPFRGLESAAFDSRERAQGLSNTCHSPAVEDIICIDPKASRPLKADKLCEISLAIFCASC